MTEDKQRQLERRQQVERDRQYRAVIAKEDELKSLDLTHKAKLLALERQSKQDKANFKQRHQALLKRIAHLKRGKIAWLDHWSRTLQETKQLDIKYEALAGVPSTNTGAQP